MLLWKWLLLKIRAWRTIAPGSMKPIIENRTEEDKFFLLHLFTVLKMNSLCANCSTAKNNSKKRKEKNIMKTHRLMSSLGEKAGLLKLLLCLAFFFSGLLKQVNTAVESKTIGVIFPLFFVSMIFCSGWAKILKQKSLSAHSLSEKEKWVWMVWNCLRKPALFFFRLPTSRALTFVADLSLILGHKIGRASCRERV